MIRLVLIALVLLGGFYAHGRLTFSEPRVMGWMTQHAARSMQGDSVACDDYADDLKVELTAKGQRGRWEVEGGKAPGNPSLAAEGELICTLVPERSRVTAARTDDVAFEWSADGCVNGRTQYGLGQGGEWKRVFAAQDDAAVAVNTYDPETRTLRTDRYLLGQEALAAARDARAAYTPPACGVSDAARTLGEQQSALIAKLPERPNERLVYSCTVKPSGTAR